MRKNISTLLILFFSSILILCAQPSLGKPEIRKVTNYWGVVTSDKTEIITDVLVYNPNPIPLPVKDVLTEIYMNDIKMGSGHALKAEIKPSSESDIIISTKIDNSKIPEWWVSHIKNNERTMMKIKGYIIFDLKITEFKYPIEIKKEIKTDILKMFSTRIPKNITIGFITLDIKSTKTYWGSVDKDHTEVITLVTIYNKNIIPVFITKIDYSIKMNYVEIANGSSDISTIIQPKSEETLTLVTIIDNSKLSKWWVSHILNHEHTKVTISLKPVIEIAGTKFKFTLAESTSEFSTHLLE